MAGSLAWTPNIETSLQMAITGRQASLNGILNDICKASLHRKSYSRLRSGADRPGSLA